MAGVVVTGDIQTAVQDIDFVNQFNQSVVSLEKILGVSRRIPLREGQKIITYKIATDLKNGTVPEGDTIPLSSVTKTKDQEYDAKLKKRRKAVSAELIDRVGFEAAVVQTDNEIQRAIQKEVRTDFFDFLSKTTKTLTATGLQEALAIAWGKVSNVFDDEGEAIHFVNPSDVATFLAKGEINATSSSAFGFTLLENYLGQRIVLMNQVPQGTVYSTSTGNLVLAFRNVSDTDMASTFELMSDANGLIGVTHSPDKTTLTYQTISVNGVTVFAEVLDGVFKTTIGTATAGA